MDKKDLQAANAFFRQAYTPDWDPKRAPEEEMVRAALGNLSSGDQARLKPVFAALLKGGDTAIEKALFYDLGCQIKPFTAYGSQYKYKDARDFLNHLVSYLDTNTSPKAATLSFDGTSLREADGSVVATLTNTADDKAKAYGRLFSVAPELADFIEDRLREATAQYESSFEDAEKFNTDVNKLGRGTVYGWKDRAYPDLPEWIKTGLTLLARLNEE